MDDLDSKAIEVMKQKYAEKNENLGFESVSDEQALSDLDLLENGKLNYAALVLLGKQKAIRKYMPQNNVLTVNSTPRSKRLAEVLQKTGRS